MNKHSYALAFALIGIGIGAYIVSESDQPSFIPVIIGGCLGIFIGYLMAGILAQRSALQRIFRDLGDLRGMTLDQIQGSAGSFSSSQNCTITDRDNEKGMFYTWSDGKYSITLLFGSDGRCIGVNKEEML